MTKETAKRVAGLFVAIVVIAGAFVYSRTSGGNDENYSADALAAVTGPSSNPILSSDNDGDGLLDWEEALWDTDVNNSDSDGDGTSDGDEVNAGRDPLIAGPGDLLVDHDPGIPPAYEYSFFDDAGENLTETIGLNLASNLIQAQGLGNFEPGEGQQLIDNLVDEAGSNFSFDSYIASDLRLVNKLDKETLESHVSKVLAVLGRGRGVNLGDELSIIESNDGVFSNRELGEFKAIAKAYKDVAGELLQVETPSYLATPHLTLINGNYHMGQGLEVIVKSKADPLTFLLGMQVYGEGLDAIHEYRSQFEAELSLVGFDINNL